MKERLGWIDIAKGICLIAVIIGHMGIEQAGFVYSFHLTTFFILSGYTLRKTDLTAEYVSQKFKRLMVPYFITCFAVVCMDVINAIVMQNICSTQAITNVLYKGIVKTFFASGGNFSFGHINAGKGIGAIWFLPAMFFALIFVQLILRLRSKRGQACAAVIVFSLAAIASKMIWLPFSLLSALFAVPFILIGKWIKEYDLLHTFKTWHYGIFLLIFAAGCFFNLAQPFYMVGCNAKDLLITPVCAVCSSLCVVGLSRLIKRFGPLEYIGKNSLIFLCVHLFEMNTITPYFKRIRQILHMGDSFLPRFFMELAFITAVSFIIIRISARTSTTELAPRTRDYCMDIFRAFLIILMIIGHVPIDSDFRKFVYSFHMIAFVMASGYFYKSGLSLCTNLKKTFKLLNQYAVFGALYLVFAQGSILTKIQNLILGISYTKELLPGATSIGPIYFILLLFVVRLVYVFVDLIRNEWLKNLAVFAIFAMGLLLGRYGYWLPWTFDGALVSLLFYHIAHYIKKYELLKKSTNFAFVYFPLSCLWAYMVYTGGMEIAVRKYGSIGIVVAGNIAAFFIVYLLCHYLAGNLPRWMSTTLAWIGQSTAYILIIHTLFGTQIRSFAANTLELNPDNIFNLVFTIIVQVAAGTLCCLMITHMKKLLLKPKYR